MSLDSSGTPRNRGLRRLGSAHRSAALMVFNILLAFVLLNLVLWIPYAWHDWKKSANPLLSHPKAWLDAAYPGWAVAERTALLEETWQRAMVYEDYVMFREREWQGRFFHVSEAGFRFSKDQGPWPPAPENFNVFVFGGSTMCGSGIPDDRTVSSFLQDAIARHSSRRVCVYNFGTSFYYSTQERLLLERLLSKGFVPAVAVFVDGLNDFIQADDTPAFRERFKDAFELANQEKNLLAAVIQQLPVGRPVRSIQARRRRPPEPDAATLAAKVDRAIENYRSNKLLIEAACAAHGVTPIFAWQPVPCYKYDLSHFPWYKLTSMHRPHPVAYPRMRELFDHGAVGGNFLWCADLQQDEKALLYVDVHHYTETFSRKFAEAICALGRERGLFKISPAQSK